MPLLQPSKRSRVGNTRHHRKKTAREEPVKLDADIIAKLDEEVCTLGLSKLSLQAGLTP